MSNLPGVFTTSKKDGTIYYRSSITINNKHISLGSFDSPKPANKAYQEAYEIFQSDRSIEDYDYALHISFKKYVSLINFRDNGIYFKTPIYLQKKFFIYYLSTDFHLLFDVDDLFYYSTRSIMKRGNHLFVADYGMQVNILSRYGIREYAVCGRDYYFANGDNRDLRYGNIIIKNKYHGVSHSVRNGKDIFTAKIHINGNFIVGRYDSEEEAAIAFNKAVDILRKNGFKKGFPENYPENLSASKYAAIYSKLKISDKIIKLKPEA